MSTVILCTFSVRWLVVYDCDWHLVEIRGRAMMALSCCLPNIHNISDKAKIKASFRSSGLG